MKSATLDRTTTEPVTKEVTAPLVLPGGPSLGPREVRKVQEESYAMNLSGVPEYRAARG